MKRMQPVILLLAAMTIFLFYKYFFRQNSTEGITRAQTARMLAWTVCDMNENSSKSAEPLIDVDSSLWYADEITAVLTDGLMKKDGDLFHPTNLLTWQEASDIAAGLGISMPVPIIRKTRPIPLEKWLQYFDLWLSQHEMAITRTLTIKALPSGDSSLDGWQVKTDSGIYSSQGLVLEPYLGQSVTAYIVGDQMLMICPKKDTHPEIMNVTETDSLTFHETNAAQSDPKNQNEPLRYPGTTSDIRVCLMNDDFTSEAHTTIILTSEAPWQMTFKDKTIQHTAGEMAELTIQDFSEEGDTAEITTENGQPVCVASLNRSFGQPAYTGRLRIIRVGDSLYLVNILPVEEYLKGVVPSEMPASYASEALKSQAVCARSYALTAIQNPKYSFADLNDSTACQVYMNQGTDPRTDNAVESTAGEVLSFHQQIASAKYFSSSCGSLSSDDDIWTYPDTGQGDSFMTARLETEPPTVCALSSEDAFIDFILHPEADTYLEASDPWFRWQVTLSMTTIRSNISELFAGRMAADPKRFTLLSSDGSVKADDILQVEVTERAASGVLQQIKLTGRDQELTVSGEYNIRCLLAPSAEETITLQDGSTRKGMALLPSGYFFLEAIRDNEEITSYKIYGGGFGHGAGLSQNGANELAEKGYDYKEILKYFFEGIDIKNVRPLNSHES